MELVGRLHPSRLGGLAAGVARPVHDRTRLRAGIVHLGLGAFARAHLAAVNEAALAAGAGEAWGICGVSLRQPDTRDALAPQDGLYTLALRDADEHGEPRQRLAAIGCLLESLVAPEDPQAVLARIAHEDARIVSLTVTEKGYCHDPASGQLNLDHPDIVHDLGQPLAPRSAIGYLAWGLQRRRAAGRGPLTLMSLDNLPANGHLLRGMVLAFAEQVDAGLARWIAAECTFPCSMVDRIVPRTTDADREAVVRALGLADAWPVMAEPYLEWVLEDSFAAGRPDWRGGGAFRGRSRAVRDAQAAQRQWCAFRPGLSVGDGGLGHGGSGAGAAGVAALSGAADARGNRADPAAAAGTGSGAVPGALAAALRQSGAQAPNAPDRHGRLAEAAATLARHRARQAGARAAHAAAGPGGGGLAALSARVDQAGRRYDIQDPMAGALARLLEQAETAATLAGPGPAAMLEWTAALAGFEPVFGELGQDARFVRAVAQAVHALRSLGVAGALEALDGGGR